MRLSWTSTGGVGGHIVGVHGYQHQGAQPGGTFAVVAVAVGGGGDGLNPGGVP